MPRIALSNRPLTNIILNFGSTPSPGLQIGDPLGGGVYIGTTQDRNGVTYNLILSPDATETDRLAGSAWPQPNNQILGTSDVDGSFNTDYIITTASNGTDGAARYFYDLNYNGYSDWYWPSKAEITTLAAAVQSGLLGSQTYLNTFRYWSSTTAFQSFINPTRFVYYAWAMDSGGSQVFRPTANSSSSMSGGRVRCVRRQLP